MDHNCTLWHFDSWHTQHRHSSDIWNTLLWATGRCVDLPIHRSPCRPAQFHLKCSSGFPGDSETCFLLPFLWNKYICSEQKKCASIKKHHIMTATLLIVNPKMFLHRFVTILSIKGLSSRKSQIYAHNCPTNLFKKGARRELCCLSLPTAFQHLSGI